MELDMMAGMELDKVANIGARLGGGQKPSV